jgi:hypothetical protein
MAFLAKEAAFAELPVSAKTPEQASRPAQLYETNGVVIEQAGSLSESKQGLRSNSPISG